MSSESALTIELSEVIIATIFCLTIIGGITIIYSPDSYKTQITTTEITYLSSIIPKDSQIKVDLKEEFEIKDNNNKILISINDFESEALYKDISKDSEIKKEGTSVIIIS